MKTFFLFIVICISFSSFAQKNADTSNSRTINKLFLAHRKILIFQDKYGISFSEKYADSVVKYNKIFASIIASKQFGKLNNYDFEEICDTTGANILISKDRKLKIISWSIFDLGQVIPNCSTIFVINDSVSKIILLNSLEKGGDYGVNVCMDTIIDLKTINNKHYYLVSGWNKCGLVCIQRIFMLYALEGSDIVQCKNAFFDGRQYSNNVGFDYSLGNKIDPKFEIVNDTLICPVLNDHGTKIIGSKKYKIPFNKDG